MSVYLKIRQRKPAEVMCKILGIFARIVESKWPTKLDKVPRTTYVSCLIASNRDQKIISNHFVLPPVKWLVIILNLFIKIIQLLRKMWVLCTNEIRQLKKLANNASFVYIVIIARDWEMFLNLFFHLHEWFGIVR